MNKYLKEFLKRGLMFGGFGPIILGIIHLVLEFTVDNFSLSGNEAFIGIISTYILAFVHAGVSVFNQIDEWSISKSTLLHLASLYAVYTLVYIVNSWIPFKWEVLLIYTGIFILAYLIIWLAVYLSVKHISRRLSERIE